MTVPRHPAPRACLGNGWLAHAFRAPRGLRPWLCDRGSLTRRLKAHYHRFEVRPLRRGLFPPIHDELRTLGMPRRGVAYVRDVLLVGDGENRVYAHSALPRNGVAGAWNRVTRLGTRPLGEALFADPLVRRHGLAVKRLTPRDTLHRAACRAAGVRAPWLWARRSVFCLAGQPLLVTEVFLPALT